jgi:glycosyltransferase involved in cell wall biosynthesis
MTTAPQVSVIVPVYNAGKYLARCLDSILAQTLKEIEVVCVDDGSADGSPALLDEYAARDGRVVVIHQPNGGISAARNTGLARASAPYIGFADHDDWMEPETYETALAIILADEEIDFVAWGFDQVADPGTPQAPEEWIRREREMFERFSGKQAVDEEVFLRTSILVWHKLYRAALIRAGQVAFPPGLLGEDYDFTWKYLAWARYGFFLDARFYHHRHWDGSAGMTKIHASETFTAFDLLEVVRDVLEYYRHHGLLPDRGLLLPRLVTQIICLGYQLSCVKDEYLRRARQVWDEFDLPTRHLGENLDYLLAKHGRLAFWGLGAYFRFNVPSPLCDRPGIFLVDRVNRDSFGRKQGQSPDVLKSEKVGLIIISAAPDSDPYWAIIRDVIAGYPDASVVPLEGLIWYPL